MKGTKVSSRLHLIMFAFYILFFLLFLISGSFLSSSTLFLFCYKASACFLISMFLFSFVVLICRGGKYFLFSLLRFLLAVLLFFIQVALKTFAFTGFIEYLS